MKKDRSINIGALIKGYYIFPTAVGAVLLVLSVSLFLVSAKAGLIAAVVFVAYMIGAAVFIVLNSRKFEEHLIDFVREYVSLERDFIKGWPIPYIVATRQGEILLYNNKFKSMAGQKASENNILDIFEGLNPEDLYFEEDEKNFSINYGTRFLRMQIRKMRLEKQHIKSQIVVLRRNEPFLYTIFLYDETEIINLSKKLNDEELAVGTMYIDNFDEMMEQIADVKKSLLIALIDREVNSYFGNVEGIVRKVENDKYFIVFKRKHLKVLEKNKFDILDNIKKIDVGNDYPITVSMGVGVGSNYTKNLEYARQGIELALGRGGDQVVLKDGGRVFFYGGKTKQVEKNTRVRARLKTLALKEVLYNKDKVVIMGHKNLDPDALGAAIGIYRAMRFLGKDAYIIINGFTNTVRPLLDNCKSIAEYKENVFINTLEAEELVQDGAALILVDANRPSIFEHPLLLDMADCIVLIDHHLQSGERIDSLEFSYVEPTASSASEMVSEILQYIGDGVKLHKEEAEAIYAGILIDTNYYSKNTGVKTFEAAAFLKKNGVDLAKVKGMFSDSLEDYKAKATAVKTAELIMPGFLIAECPTAGLTNPTVVAAQVADELLDISGIVGSFVLANVSGRIYISARSKGDVNVQRVMEKLGGGGHLNMAGAQMEDVSIDEAEKRVAYTLRKMKEEGNI